MAYRVEILPRAGRDLRRIYQTINAEHARQAQTWFNGLTELVLSLADHPARGPRISETPALRHVLHGKGRNVYRVIYAIDETKRIVSVLHIRHGAQDFYAHDED